MSALSRRDFAKIAASGLTAGRLVPEGDDEVGAVREVMRLHDAGETLGAIAAWLNGNGFTTTEGKAWGHKQVSRVIGARQWYAKAGVIS